jgi:hypothetical protein
LGGFSPGFPRVAGRSAGLRAGAVQPVATCRARDRRSGCPWKGALAIIDRFPFPSTFPSNFRPLYLASAWSECETVTRFRQSSEQGERRPERRLHKAPTGRVTKSVERWRPRRLRPCEGRQRADLGSSKPARTPALRPGSDFVTRPENPNSNVDFFAVTFAAEVHHCVTFRHGRHDCTATDWPASGPAGAPLPRCY